jgi:hypothetical protein
MPCGSPLQTYNQIGVNITDMKVSYNMFALRASP